MQIQGLSCLVKDLKVKKITKEIRQNLFVNDLDLVDLSLIN
jgi:hypothetical protein